MTAIITLDEKYRYRLERTVADKGFRVSVFMVNPSTADAVENDPTIRKLIGFGSRLGWKTITVGNLFAHRATDVNDLASASEPIGPINNAHLLSIMVDTDISVVAWGALGKLPMKYRNEWRKIPAMAAALKRPLWCFGTCADGHPKHPVMIAYASMMQTWDIPV